MIEQLSLFEAFGVEIFDARIHEEAVKEAKRESMKNAAAAKEVKVETPKVDPKEEIKQILILLLVFRLYPCSYVQPFRMSFSSSHAKSIILN